MNPRPLSTNEIKNIIKDSRLLLHTYEVKSVIVNTSKVTVVETTNGFIIKILKANAGELNITPYEKISLPTGSESPDSVVASCNICKLVEYRTIKKNYPIENTNYYVIVMENCGTDLKDIVITVADLLKIAIDILDQILCLHSKKIFHGDIKLENVTLKKTIAPPEKTVIKEGQLETKRQSLGFLWKTRRFILNSDSTFTRLDDDTVRNTMRIVSTTRVEKLNDTEFTLTFNMPDFVYHMRASTSEECNKWVVALKRMINNVDNIDVKLIDLDDLPKLQWNTNGTVSFTQQRFIFTPLNTTEKQSKLTGKMIKVPETEYESLKSVELPFIPTESKRDLVLGFNVPYSIGYYMMRGKMNDTSDSFSLVEVEINPEYLFYIDIFSWCIIVFECLTSIQTKNPFNLSYPVNIYIARILKAIVVNMMWHDTILSGGDAEAHIRPFMEIKSNPVKDFFDNDINSEYCKKVIEGLKTLQGVLIQPVPVLTPVLGFLNSMSLSNSSSEALQPQPPPAFHGGFKIKTRKRYHVGKHHRRILSRKYTTRTKRAKRNRKVKHSCVRARHTRRGFGRAGGL